MRNMNLIPVLAAALVFSGCGEDSALLSPGPAAAPSFAAAVRTPFTASMDFTAPPDDPGDVTFTDGVIHVRGEMTTAPVSGDIVGTAIGALDVDVVLASGKGSGRGSVTIDTEDGIWEVEFRGTIDLPVFSGHFQGQGISGDVAGQKMGGSFTDEAVDNVVVLSGWILDPDAD